MRRQQRWARRSLRIVIGIAVLSAVTPAISAGVTPTTTWIDLYSTASHADGQPLPAGAIVAVFDPDGVMCAQFPVTTAGVYGVTPCYGDDANTPADEGAQSGDPLSFAVNGRAATATAISLNGATVAPGTPVIWQSSGALWEVDLCVDVKPVEPAPKLEPPAVTLDWYHTDAAVVTYELWRSSVPIFTPAAVGSILAASLAPAPNGVMSWRDPATAADGSSTLYYRVRSLDGGGAVTGVSETVGRFVFPIAQ